MTLFAPLLLWAPFEATWQALWVERWMVVVFMAASSLIWSLPFRRRVYPWALTYFMGMAAFGSASIEYVGGKAWAAPIQPQAMGQLLCGFALLVFIIGHRDFRSALKWAGVACAAACIASGWHSNQVWPMSNPSMTGTFIALTLATETDWTWFLGLMAVFFTGRHIPLGIWPIIAAWSKFGAGMPIALFWLLGAAIMTLGDSERLYVWDVLQKGWAHSDWPHLLFGRGAGSTPAVLSQFTTPAGQTFIWAHNDWLQTEFEYGLVGLVLALWVFYRLFQDSPRKQQAVLFGFGLSMFGNFPLHWPLTALALWINCKEGLLDTLQRRKKAGATRSEHGAHDGPGESIIRTVSDHCRPWRDSLHWH